VEKVSTSLPIVDTGALSNGLTTLTLCQLNSTQQRITDAGVRRLQVRIVIVGPPATPARPAAAAARDGYRPYTITNEQYQFATFSDRFPVPVRSAVKSNFTNWCCQNLSKRALNALTANAGIDSLS